MIILYLSIWLWFITGGLFCLFHINRLHRCLCRAVIQSFTYKPQKLYNPTILGKPLNRKPFKKAVNIRYIISGVEWIFGQSIPSIWDLNLPSLTSSYVSYKKRNPREPKKIWRGMLRKTRIFFGLPVVMSVTTISVSRLSEQESNTIPCNKNKRWKKPSLG